MLAQKPADLMDNYRAACEWWELAGVSYDFSDHACDWLEVESAAQNHGAARDHTALAGSDQGNPNMSSPRPDAVRTGTGTGTGTSTDVPTFDINPETIGATLDQFQKWWCTDNETLVSGAGPRVAPRGPAHAPVMMIVPQPEKSDYDTLLSGEFGNFIAAFLSCADVDQDSVYFASVVPQYAEIPDWRNLAQRGIGRLLAHHIRLAKPKRVIVFGRHLQPLIGHDGSKPLSDLQLPDGHEGQELKLPLFTAPAPTELLRSAERRKRFWQNWLQWSEQFAAD